MDYRNGWSTYSKAEGTLPQQIPTQRRQLHRKHTGPFKRLISLALSAVLLGGISAGIFYGVGQFFPEEASLVAAENFSSSGGVLTCENG